MEATLQSIFRHGYPAYARERTLPLKSHQAAHAIMNCRTEVMGGHIQRCPDHHEQHVQYHSCKHRSCPRCSALPKAQWVDAQQARLLHCDHYHAIFTLPHALLGLWRFNQHWFTNALFQSCRDTLLTLLKDPHHLGALPGIVMSMHTWGRTLSLHPHIHCLVTGGGLTKDNHWKPVKHHFLLPVKVVKALYKGKLLARLWEALQHDALQLPPGQTVGDIQRLLRQLKDKEWNVCIRERYAHGKGVMLYLSRYVKGGAISNQRIVDTNDRYTTVQYQDHRDQRNKTLPLQTRHFIERVLWHVPEKGQHWVRHYGLYSHQGRDKRNRCRTFLNQAPEQDHIDPLDWQRFLADIGQSVKSTCSTCGQALIRCGDVSRKRWRYQISIDKPHLGGIVQPALQHNTARGMDLSTGPPTTQ
jgi:hypothetical protein